MTKEQYEKEIEWRWKEFWDAIVINAIDNNYWKSIFRDAFETGFNRGFAYANDKPYSDAVFEHRNLSQDSANCDNHIVQDHELVEHFAEVRNMLRLKIASQMAQGMLLVKEPDIYYRRSDGMMTAINKDPKSVAEVAVMFADALIAECQKGGAK